ncbi:L-aspartate oxidase [Paeniglutamicibacter sulfureus]|uniref:L-aspartate oxidase n=1 Tax=Paeniglutamicibacter sulfureus TaxID=43666 RepID=UPI0026652A2D|nr:L-aspartate oxidase [Paeniglutamicibacter sulfureus]MDO2935890.1 L-aspartate oxidase [Paeniglutamicibacter sulfureus]
MNATGLVVVGSGVAGLYAALTAAVRGLDVVLLTKDALADSNSWYAQGGLSAVGPAGVAAGDSIASHIADTLTAGAQLNDADAVAIMCTSAWGHVQRLIGAGAEFDTDASGTFALGLEAAHAHPRILHAGGDATGKGLASALIAACRAQQAAGRLEIREHAFVTELLTEENPYAEAGSDRQATMVTGVRVLGGEGQSDELHAEAVLLATGGAGQLFAATTNPHGATGDGAALAYRAGAVLADAEFIQFHPTLVSPGGFMVSEAVRGEGAVLLNERGERFMQAVHPDAELAPRDVVARAIHAVRAQGGTVHLDARAVEARHGAGFLARRFPSITRELKKLGYDLAAEPVPVTPAAHYWMGGILTNDTGASTLPGLFAAGETACTGVNGANRLASNSLLEGLVFAWRTVVNLPSDLAAATALAAAVANSAGMKVMPTRPAGAGNFEYSGSDPAETATADMELAQLQELAQLHLGVDRTAEGLRSALDRLACWRVTGNDRASRERANLLTVATVVATAALERENSIGAHYRSDAIAAPQPVNGHLPRFGRALAATAATQNLRTKTLV